MSRVDKKIRKWIENTPKDAPIEEVLSIIERFFPDQYSQKSGSHIVIQDDKLKGLEGYGPAGDFSVPVKGGKKVKGFYLKRLAKTIQLLKKV